LIAALDADKNGTISASELESAPESLKQLDKNADGELSPEEIRPQGPPPAAHEPDVE
jgi:Ca2+-binding EF-hand superfamily protein